jgi:hypothetical protein
VKLFKKPKSDFDKTWKLIVRKSLPFEPCGPIPLQRPGFRGLGVVRNPRHQISAQVKGTSDPLEEFENRLLGPTILLQAAH